MNNLDQLSRRDFLGLVLLGPTAAAIAGTPTVDNRPIYRGSMRELMSGILPGAEWRARFYALVESVDAPRSDWRVKRMSALAMLHHEPTVDLPDLLRSHHIVRLCEADLSPRPGGPDKPFCFADVTVFDDVSNCETAWQTLASKIAVGEVDALPDGLGDAACVGHSSGKWTLKGKVFFRRANVTATIFAQSSVPGYEASRFAADIDRRIAAMKC